MRGGFNGVRWGRGLIWVLLGLMMAEGAIFFLIISRRVEAIPWEMFSWMVPSYLQFFWNELREWSAPLALAFVFIAVGRAWQFRVFRGQVLDQAQKYVRQQRAEQKERIKELEENNASLSRQNMRYRQAEAVHLKANQLAENEVQRRVG